ncbi:hypothetical protein VP01_4234g1 [Puccinia sorghi]|uniref:Uncharacterized protein n=1 Tax=Puccinia sorghi TaxID=27349 RepID=A0A0L6UQI3_9BASI|nr:hypothetical protein VP01_4234g1 [Puccinia sorghi]
MPTNQTLNDDALQRLLRTPRLIRLAPPPATDTTTPTKPPSPFLNPMNPSELPYTRGAFSNASGSMSRDNSTKGLSALTTVPKPDEQLTAKLVRLLLASQHTSSVQSIVDQQALAEERRSHQEQMAQFEWASNERMAQFEQAILCLLMKVHDFQLLLVSPFQYSTFEQRVAAFDENLPRQVAFNSRPAMSSQQEKLFLELDEVL